MIWRRVLYHVNIHQSHNIPWQLLNTLKVCHTNHQASSYSSSFTGITYQTKKGSNSFLPKLLRTDLSLIPQLGCISDRDNVYVYDKNQQTSHSTMIKLGYDLHGTIRDTLREGNITEKVPRIAFLCDNDMFYVVTQLAIWLCGGIGVPLCKTHPESEWKYVMENSKCSAVVKSMKTSLPVSNIPVIDISHKSLHQWTKDCRGDMFHVVQNVPSADDPALIIYTSGTTGPPKGVVLSHRNLITNINDMIISWEWNRRKQDTILHCLPLHHVHGVVNALWTPIFCGANIVMLPKFNASVVWKILTKAAVEDFSKEDIENLQFHPTSLLVNGSMINITVFMGVPTIYVKLIEYFDQISGTGSKREGTSDSSCISHRNFNHIRLMVSGSAALRKDVMKKWKEISDHDLLERYGMTEIGMALTNPLHGEKTPGAVGNPFHSVEVKIARENKNSEFGYDTLCVGNHECTIVKEGLEEVQGELLVKGEGVFKEYYENTKATTESFTKDAWFKTGDTAEFKDGVYRILGRSSVDVIKSGGYKISALDIEAILFTHSDIIDCAVVGVDDLVWGQRVAAVIVLNSKDTNMTLKNLQNWCKGKMPDYKIPSVLQVVEELPKNAMGKIEKKKIAKLYFD